MRLRNRLGSSLALLMVAWAGLVACAGMTGKEMGSDKDMMMEKKPVMAAQASSAGDREKSTMEAKADTSVRTAMLNGAGGHHASGKVTVSSSTRGASAILFTDFAVDRVPDGRVYLAKNGDHRRGVELGRLTQFSGTLTFPVPTGVSPEDYDSVVIWCKQFDVKIGHAVIEKPRMEGDHGMMK